MGNEPPPPLYYALHTQLLRWVKAFLMVGTTSNIRKCSAWVGQASV